MRAIVLSFDYQQQKKQHLSLSSERLEFSRFRTFNAES